MQARPERPELGHARQEVVLRGLSPGTIYTVRSRGKLDGISYSGYWSAWTQPVSMKTPPAGGSSVTHTLTHTNTHTHTRSPTHS